MKGVKVIGVYQFENIIMYLISSQKKSQKTTTMAHAPNVRW